MRNLSERPGVKQNRIAKWEWDPTAFLAETMYLGDNMYFQYSGSYGEIDLFTGFIHPIPKERLFKVNLERDKV